MMHHLRYLSALLAALLLVACSSAPKFNTEAVESGLTPRQAAGETTLQRGKKVLWGGMIVTSNNLEGRTAIEVLAYPLDGNHFPQTDQPPYGRFMLLHEGYLETVDYAPGRLISAVGRFEGTRSGRIGQSEYLYPLMQAEQLHLWPRNGKGNTRFHFGIGVILGN